MSEFVEILKIVSFGFWLLAFGFGTQKNRPINRLADVLPPRPPQQPLGVHVACIATFSAENGGRRCQHICPTSSTKRTRRLSDRCLARDCTARQHHGGRCSVQDIPSGACTYRTSPMGRPDGLNLGLGLGLDGSPWSMRGSWAQGSHVHPGWHRTATVTQIPATSFHTAYCIGLSSDILRGFT